LPGNVNVEPQRAVNGDYFVWLDPVVVNRLAALRGPGESHFWRYRDQRLFTNSLCGVSLRMDGAEVKAF
jgi:hypothetical protein